MSFLSFNLHFRHFLLAWSSRCAFGVLVLTNTTPVTLLSNTGWRGQSCWSCMTFHSSDVRVAIRLSGCLGPRRRAGMLMFPGVVNKYRSSLWSVRCNIDRHHFSSGFTEQKTDRTIPDKELTRLFGAVPHCRMPHGDEKGHTTAQPTLKLH